MISVSKYSLEIFKNSTALSKGTAEFIISTATKAVAERGQFSIALSGGNTPLKLYQLLAESPYKEQMPWQHTFIFWGDERCVSVDDEQNNAHQAKQALINKVKIPSDHVYPIPVNLLPTEAARQYEKNIRDFFGSSPQQFDLILLGLGENGHTASLFPGTTVLQEKKAGIREVYVEEQHMFRITMTAPLINLARHILFLVSGESKASVLEEIMNGPQADKYPAQLIKPRQGKVYWFADEKAAALLSC